MTSPILSNIYLDRLDTFVDTVLIPEYTRGESRAGNPAYTQIASAIQYRRRKNISKGEHPNSGDVRELRQRVRRLPSGDPQDPGYRRLRYIRYADDHLLGFTGPKAEAEDIKQRLATFLRDDLKLELNEDKTLITHARTHAARFLGYEITTRHCNDKLFRSRKSAHGVRAANGSIALRVPLSVIKAHCAPYLKRGKPAHLPSLTGHSDYDIVGRYGARYRGVVQYYLLASDVWRFERLNWVMLTSMLKTLAAKHRSTVTTMANKHMAVVVTPHGHRRCFEVRVERVGRKPLVARYGGIPLKRQQRAVVDDRVVSLMARPRRRKLIDRLLRRRCELCESHAAVEVHQVRTLADLAELAVSGSPQPAWVHAMVGKRRKTLVVCSPCHHSIHAPSS